jgi:hypothetical protein
MFVYVPYTNHQNVNIFLNCYFLTKPENYLCIWHFLLYVRWIVVECYIIWYWTQRLPSSLKVATSEGSVPVLKDVGILYSKNWMRFTSERNILYLILNSLGILFCGEWVSEWVTVQHADTKFQCTSVSYCAERYCN